ncbi:MAG: family 78 glycoside hydrolase catalytic domain, partial [Clostridia bacterium]|nr:family 78 glycoside hydrolase catalytic domain [Clostridia bacterium]
EIDLTPYLREGENLIAVHTLYQGLINRVWQSGDLRHGLLLDLVVDGETVVASDESFKTTPHTAYREVGTVGYATAFLEEYDSRAPEVGFASPDYDDASWQNARLSLTADHTLVPQKTEALVFEHIKPVRTEKRGNTLFADFGKCYAANLCATVRGKAGDTVILRMGQELNEDGSVRANLRAYCHYEEPWILADGESVLDHFDYKAFRFAEMILPEGCEVLSLYLEVRHYPFSLVVEMNEGMAKEETLKDVWELCVNTQKYGVQEAILDCMEREKGFYLGDGCYTALTHMVLTGKEDMARKLIDEAFLTTFITDGLVTCLNCAFMQEIAEYPLMLIKLVLWHYRLTGDKDYLAVNYPKVTALLEAYRRDYEKDGLLRDLDKWCVVEWPANFRDGYDVDITEGKVCHEPHVAINAYYLEAVAFANEMADVLSLPPYRDTASLKKAFYEAFYLPEKHLFKDSLHSDHVSMVGNIFPFAFGLCPDEQTEKNIIDMMCERGMHAVSFFSAFPFLEGLVRCGKASLLPFFLNDADAWRRMLREDATTTFEGWGRDTKFNTSLFHMTLSFGALFLSDAPLATIFAPLKGERKS